MPPIGPGPDERTNFRRKVILTISLFMAVVVSVAISLYRWHNGVDAQNYAVRVMFSVTEDYVKLHHGAWPRSWEDLESVPIEGKWYEDSLDYNLVKKYVVIDFDASPEELAKQVPAEFHAIDAKNPVFDFSRDPRLVRLLQTLKSYHSGKEEGVSSNSYRGIARALFLADACVLLLLITFN